MIQLNRAKDGKKNILTLSYDDGAIHDRRLIEIMNRHGIRGTFHLNSDWLDDRGKTVELAEMPELYKNHEVSCHGVRHRSLGALPAQNVMLELFNDRRALEQICGYPIRGMSYANGWYTEEAITALKSCGIVYARTTEDTNRFVLPENFMKWHPTCHHSKAPDCAERFLKSKDSEYCTPHLFYVWGHSYEFERNDNWSLIEEFCGLMGGREDIWYATNIEIYEYITAQRNLVIGADNKMVYNPSAIRVWFTAEGETLSVGPGELLQIG